MKTGRRGSQSPSEDAPATSPPPVSALHDTGSFFAPEKAPKSEPSNVVRAFFRFHRRSAVRVALRAAGAQITAIVVVVGMQPSPGGFIDDLSRLVASGTSGLGFFFAFWSWINAETTMRRAGTALRGWFVHLPASTRQRRRAALWAAALGQTPAPWVWAILWLVALGRGHGPDPAQIPAMILVVIASGAAVLPWRRRRESVLAQAALVFAAIGVWPTILLSMFCLWKIERSDPALRTSLPPKSAPQRFARRIPWTLRVHLRTIRGSLFGIWLQGLLPFGATWLFLRNNEELSAEAIALGARVGGGLSCALIVLGAAATLRPLRPAWAWGRSLPWSARARVSADALLFAVYASPVFAGVIALAWSRSQAQVAWLAVAAPLACALVWTSIRLAGALHRQEDEAPPKSSSGGSASARQSLTHLGAWAATETFLVFAVAAATPWAMLAFLLLSPWALRAASRREQAFKVSRWNEMRELGEPS